MDFDLEAGVVGQCRNTNIQPVQSVPISTTLSPSSTAFEPVIKHSRTGQWVASVQKTFTGLRSSFDMKVRTLEDCPAGYPRLAVFLDSDENFMMYRRFGYIQTRLLLDKQNELRDLEEQLEESDKGDEETCPEKLSTGELDEEDSSPKKKLLKKLGIKFSEYAGLLAAAQQMMSMQRPSTSAHESVCNFFHHKAPVCDGDDSWIYCKEDLVALRPGREHAWLDDTIEYVLKMLNCRLIEYIFCSEETKRKSTDPKSIYYTRSRIERLVVGIITMMILALLVVPIYVLYHLTNDVAQGPRTTAVCIGVLLVFTLAFSAVLSLFTRARRHEILASAAAYCAVLVVFLGNVPRPG